MSKQTFQIAMLAVLLLAACVGDPLTRDNGAVAKAPAVTTSPTGKTETCACTKSGTFCEVEQAGATLHCETFTGGCDATGECKSDPAQSKSNACPNGQSWQGSSAWASASSSNFVCVVSSSAPCTATGCKSDFMCNAGSGACEPIPTGFFKCQTQTCTATSAQFCSADGKTSVKFMQFGDNICAMSGGAEACAAASGTEVDTACVNGCDAASGTCKSGGSSGGGNIAQGDVQCVVHRKDTTTWAALKGGTVASFSLLSQAPWMSLGSPNNNGSVFMTLPAGDSCLEFLPVIKADGSGNPLESGFGFDAQGNIAVEGDWEVKCDGLPTYTFQHGAITMCGATKSLACGWHVKKTTFDEFRLAYCPR